MITVGSLFAGIGGIELGLERAGGFKTIWQVENDPYAIKVLEKHWPDVTRCGDIRNFPPRSYEFEYSWRGMPKGRFAPDIKRDTTRNKWYADLICGGFPCQDISSVGKRAGIGGEQSGLWGEFARIIGVLRPRFVLVENVSALLVRGIDRVLGDLATLGYDAEWESIPATAVGAPHIRDRVFIIAYANTEMQQRADDDAEAHDPGRLGQTLPDALGRSGNPGAEQTGRETRADISGSGKGSGLANASRIQQGRQEQRSPGRGWWDVEPDVGRVGDGVPSRVDRLRCLGNAVVPQVAELIGNMIMESL